MSRTPITPPPADVFLEKQVAHRCGVSRTRLRELRLAKLTEGTDWRLHENAVVLTQSGLANVERLLAADAESRAAAPKPAAAKESPAVGKLAKSVVAGPPPRALFVVVRVPVYRTDAPQTKILIGREVAKGFAPCTPWELAKKLEPAKVGAERPIRVRDNTNFKPGMVLEAAASGPGMFQFLGRLPRRPGRW